MHKIFKLETCKGISKAQNEGESNSEDINNEKPTVENKVPNK